MKKILIIFALVGVTTFISCEKITDTTWVYYDETFCADPWGNANIGETEKIKAIGKYLKEQKVKFFKVKIVHDASIGAITCYACNCKSGNRIHVEIDRKDVSKALNENFYQ
ncbi:MAG TPA: hypothetical protein PL084_00265 [Chitinophagales bacterium]|nr:hypothetical protein [Chitinophagales bacterium]HRP39859.1 hypothetical protein [Chitinophagales bacterium]